ncbi:hypothetical protein BJV74DRAFT_962225 [Russula compacta]|nr:hypothetical protein BJV74DRAFT_962225 [Russula compacta]
MTRTERSHSLRALLKDRSEARNGMDSSVPKGGAGAYNWGSIDSEFDYENAAIADGAEEDQAQEPGAPNPQPQKAVAVRRTSSVTDEDRENAIKIRKNALNGGAFPLWWKTKCVMMTPFQDIDLAAIARSSVAVSCSPPKNDVLTSNTFVS